MKSKAPKALTKAILKLVDGLGNINYISITANDVHAYGKTDMGMSLGNYIQGKFSAQDLRDGLELALPKGIEEVVQVCKTITSNGYTVTVQRVWEKQ